MLGNSAHGVHLNFCSSHHRCIYNLFPLKTSSVTHMCVNTYGDTIVLETALCKRTCVDNHCSKFTSVQVLFCRFSGRVPVVVFSNGNCDGNCRAATVAARKKQTAKESPFLLVYRNSNRSEKPKKPDATAHFAWTPGKRSFP